MKHIDNEIQLQITRVVDYLAAATNDQSIEALGLLHQKLISALNHSMEALYETNEDHTDQLSVDNVTIEVTAPDTKRVYRRLLPLDYQETDNGITLSGEDLNGKPVSISFLSKQALDKISDLTGQGLNSPRCNHH